MLPMNYGIITKILSPVRSGPDHRNEMINQMLFGEGFIIKEEIGEWIKIESLLDSYSGWIVRKEIKTVTKENIEINFKTKAVITKRLTLIYNANDKDENFLILPGSTLPGFNKQKNTFHIGSTNYIVETNSFTEQARDLKEAIIETARTFLHAPYLWGGRSVFGIDCSGFTQIVFKINGINLPRDASQQAGIGALVPFLKESKPGDLAFFDNEDGNIMHVGILAGQGKIIHASGDVHIDSIDYQGIIEGASKGYSHKLRLIKSIF